MPISIDNQTFIPAGSSLVTSTKGRRKLELQIEKIILELLSLNPNL
jgi:hypothetical protein